MNIKILGFFAIFLIFLIIPIAEAQVSTIEKSKQELVEVTIDSDGLVKVKHVLASPNTQKQIDFIIGTVSSLSVTSETGVNQEHKVIGENTGLLIMPSDEKIIVEYYLEDVLVQEDGLWKWNFRYLESTNFIMSPGVDLFFVNDRPIYMQEDKKGFRCHGCQIVLEYSIDEPKYFGEIIWEDKRFQVEIQTLTEIKNFSFSQPEKKLSFFVSEDNQFVTVVIPLELLWEPYIVLLNDEQIVHYQFFENETHAWINLRPESAGEVSIIGTTVVPEFPLVAPLAIGLIIVLAAPLVRKFNLH